MAHQVASSAPAPVRSQSTWQTGPDASALGSRDWSTVERLLAITAVLCLAARLDVVAFVTT